MKKTRTSFATSASSSPSKLVATPRPVQAELTKFWEIRDLWDLRHVCTAFHSVADAAMPEKLFVLMSKWFVVYAELKGHAFGKCGCIACQLLGGCVRWPSINCKLSLKTYVSICLWTLRLIGAPAAMDHRNFLIRHSSFNDAKQTEAVNKDVVQLVRWVLPPGQSLSNTEMPVLFKPPSKYLATVNWNVTMISMVLGVSPHWRRFTRADADAEQDAGQFVLWRVENGVVRARTLVE